MMKKVLTYFLYVLHGVTASEESKRSRTSSSKLLGNDLAGKFLKIQGVREAFGRKKWGGSNI